MKGKHWKAGAKSLFLFLTGGFLYIGLEILTRGFSHISMFLAGGVSFLLIGLINEKFPEDMALTSQMLLSSLIITAVELITGLIVNVWMKAGVWDYSSQPYNFRGQICLLFSNLWFFLSLPAILLDDWIRFHFLGERKKKYKIL